MAPWAALSTDLLWRQALALIPLALIVAALARWLPCRPATRHLLWLTALLWLAVAPWLPQPPSRNALSALVERAGDTVASTRDVLVSMRERRGPDLAVDPTSSEPPVVDEGNDANGLVSFERQRSVVRLHPRGQARAPSVLAQASGPNGPPTHFDSIPATYAVYIENPVDWVCEPATPNPVMVPKSNTTRKTTSPAIPDVALGPFPAAVAVLPQAASLEPTSTRTFPPDNVAEADGLADVPHVPSNAATARRPQVKSLLPPSAVALTTWIAALAAAADAVLSVPPIPPEVWLAGAGLLAFGAMLRIALFHRLVRRSIPAPAEIQRTVRLAALGVGVRRVPVVSMTDQPISPMVWCGRRARLILPSLLWEQLDERGRRAVVYHELSHLRRRDHWVSWFEMLIGIAYWWYPLVWWIRGRVRAEAENSCDAWVTTLLPRDRRAYAEALLRTTHFMRYDRRRMPAIVMGVTTGRANRFARRLRMVMTETVKPRSSFGGVGLVLLIAAFGWVATPARSCPSKDQPKARVSAPCAKSGAAVAASPCGMCKKGSPCAACAKAPSLACCLCKDCKAGGCKLCERCRSTDECQSCEKCRRTPKASAGEPAVAPDARTTYEAYMADRSRQAESVAPLIAQAIGAARDGLRQIGGSDDDELEERLERLEEQLSRLAEKLERMSDGPGRTHPGEPPHGPPPGAPRRPRQPLPPEPPMPGHTPHPAQPPHAPRAVPPAPGHFDLLPGDGNGEVGVRTYRLPDGKRQALVGLMARDDVPIKIRALTDGIEVHATPRQHRIFQAFLRLIHPEGDEGSEAAPPEGTFARERFAERRMAREHLDETREQMKQVRREVREAMRRARAESGGRSREQVREIHEAQLEKMEKHIDEMHERSDKIRESAEKLREKAEKLREKAEKVREKADKEKEKAQGDGSAAEALVAEASTLDAQAGVLDEQALEADEAATEVESEVQGLDSDLAELNTAVEEFEIENESDDEESNDDDESAHAAHSYDADHDHDFEHEHDDNGDEDENDEENDADDADDTDDDE